MAYAKKQTQIVETPQGVDQLWADFEGALRTKDRNRLLEFYHSDYRAESGRNREEQVDYLLGNIAYITRWKATVTRFEMTDDKAYLGGSVDYGTGSFEMPKGASLIRQDGKWLFYGIHE